MKKPNAALYALTRNPSLRYILEKAQYVNHYKYVSAAL